MAKGTKRQPLTSRRGDKIVLGMSLKNFMVLVLSTSLAMGVVLSSGCLPSVTKTPETLETTRQEITTQPIHNITPQAANDLIQENGGNPDFIILDVRTSAEFVDGHIENAINLDFYSETISEEIDQLNKSKIYLVYCRSGVRSLNSAKIMEGLNFSNVYNMLDGIIRWRGEGLPTVK